MGEKKKKSLVREGLILSLMTFASRIMGLIRQTTSATFLGTSMYADAFYTAFQIPNFLRRLFAENCMSVAFIPTFKGYLDKGSSDEDRKETQEFLNAIMTLLSFLTTCIVVIGIIATPLIMPLFCKKPADTSAVDYASQIEAWLLQKQTITLLTRIMFPYLTVISIAALFQGILNGCRIFAPSGFTPVLFNSTVIAVTYIFSAKADNPAVSAKAMAIGVILGGTIQVFFQLPFVLKTGWKIQFTSLKKTFTNPGTKKVLALIAPAIFGIAAYQLNDLVSTTMAMRAGEGIASSLQYSLRLQELILGIFVVSISTVILPDLTGLAVEQNWVEFNKILIQALKIVTVITIPVTFYSFVSGRELISLLYKNKMFDETSVNLTLSEFRYHIAGLFFIAANRIISPAFYAQKNTKLPTAAGIISFGANIILVLALVKPMGGQGIALALSLASAVNTAFLIIFMKKMQSFDIKTVLKQMCLYIIKIIIFSIIAAVPCYFIRPVIIAKFSGYSRFIAHGAPTLVTALIFFIIGVGLLVITKDEIAFSIVRKFLKKQTTKK